VRHVSLWFEVWGLKIFEVGLYGKRVVVYSLKGLGFRVLGSTASVWGSTVSRV
jgi:hypothetical protein